MARPDAPRSGLQKHETRQSLASFNWNITFRTVADNICGGNTFVLVTFALSLGIAGESMGVFTSVMSFACILQMLALPFISRILDRKRFVITLGIVEPLVMIGAVLMIPFLPGPWRFGMLVLAVLAAAACLQLTKPMADDWMALVIPAGLRGRFWGRRTQLMSLAAIIVGPTLGAIAGLLDDSDTHSFGMLLIVGGLFGILAALALRHASLPVTSFAPGVKSADILRVFKTRPFRRYLLAIATVNLPFYLVMAYYQVFHISILNMNKFSIGCIAAAYGVVKICAAPVWGRYVNRIGTRKLLIALCPGYIPLFASYALAGTGRVWPIFAAWTVCGVLDAGWLVAINKTLYDSIRGDTGRPAFFAVANLTIFGLYGVGSAVAVLIVKALEPVALTLGPFVLEQFHILFGISTILMFPACLGPLFLPRRATRSDA